MRAPLRPARQQDSRNLSPWKDTYDIKRFAGVSQPCDWLSMPLPPCVTGVWHHNVQIKDLNSGTFGFVQLALDRTTGRNVAIKFIERGDKVRADGSAAAGRPVACGRPPNRAALRISPAGHEVCRARNH